MKLDPCNTVRIQPTHQDKPCLLYVHVPFCETLCTYCSFHREPLDSKRAESYFHALRAEIRYYHMLGFEFSEVYVGGGTPTIVPEELDRTLALIRSLFSIREISVETNPNGLCSEILDMLKNNGVGRLSVGVQSFDDELLRKMDRYDKYGSGEEMQNLLKSTQGMFQTLNVDMIFGFPGQTLDSLRRDLDILLALEVDQVSFYPMMSSPTIRDKTLGTIGRTYSKRYREYFRIILNTMRLHYQNSSAWCFSRKNGMIDEYIINHDDYIGVGSGSFSYIAGVMYVTSFSLEQYAEQIERGLTGITHSKSLTLRQRILYDLLVKLFGLSLDREYITRKYGVMLWGMMFPPIVAMRILGVLRNVDGCIRLTERGKRLWVYLMFKFFKAVNGFREQMYLQIQSESRG